MFEASLDYTPDFFDGLINAIDGAPAAIDAYAERAVLPVVETFVSQHLGVTPGPVVYPIEWTPSRHPEDADKPPNTAWGYYSRQKAAFFATDGFGRGIPTQRTNTMIEAWNVYLDRESGAFVVENPVAYTPYVQGTWQQQYHGTTGWQNAGNVLQPLVPQIDDMMAYAWSRLITGGPHGRGRARRN